YTKLEYKKDDLPLPFINHEYIYGFKIFLQTHHNCKNNGAVNLLKALRNFILYSMRNDWIEKNPMRDIKMKEEVTEVRAHLTKAELEGIIAKEMPNERLERVRDVFIFCCLTGLAFTDADHLSKAHIVRDDEGNVWIHKPRQKTSIMSVIPLLPYARQILEKYSIDAECAENGKLLPICSNQRMNSYLKEIATICNINKLLTTHCARHTFACVAIEYGMPIETIAKILGHTKVQMTRHYARLSDGAILRDMVKLNERMQLNDGITLKKAQ
ncbi:site-specific integrase, partial [Barnesiella intestinihominis]